MKFKRGSKVLAAFLVVAMLLTLVPIGAFAADSPTFTISKIEGAQQQLVMVNGVQKVIYCMQYDYLWPTYDNDPDYRNNPTTYWKASPEEMLLNANQLTTIQRVLYAGYPYDGIKALAPLYNAWGPDAADAAANLTQHIVWSYMAEWGVPHNETYGTSNTEDYDVPEYEQVEQAIRNFADSPIPLPTQLPNGFSPQLNGNAVFAKTDEEDGFKTGNLTISNPQGFSVMYNVTLPDGVYPMTPQGEMYTPQIDFNDNWEPIIKGYSIYSGTEFYLYADEYGYENLNGQAMTFSGSIQIPTDVEQYMTNDKGWGIKNGQNYAWHPYQTMLSVGVDSLDLFGSYTFSNTKSVTVIKKWDKDDAPADYSPLSSVTVSLVKDDVVMDGEEYTVVLNEGNNWTHKWKDLDATAVYAVEEHALGEGYYEPTYYNENHGSDQIITITNKPKYETIKVTKIWEDNNNDAGLRPVDVNVELVKKIGTGGNTTAEKVGNTVTLNDGNNWKYEWTVPSLDDGEYEVVEITESPFYSVDYDEDEDAGEFQIINTLKTQNVSVEKKWIDNESDHRPNSIEVKLYRETPNGTHKPAGEVTLSNSNGWAYTWEKLPYGKYIVVEEAMNGTANCFYDSDVSEVSVPDSEDQKFVITNTHITHSSPTAIDFKVTKKWQDKDGNSMQEAPANSEVILQLYRVTSSALGFEEVGNEISLRGGNDNWTYTWPNLEPGDYFVQELHVIIDNVHSMEYFLPPVITPKEYNEQTDWVNGTLKKEVTITNREKSINISVEKEWADGNDKHTADDVVVYLLMMENADGTLTPVEEIILTAQKLWQHVWEKLPFGKYTVVEEMPDGYRLQEFKEHQDTFGNWNFTLKNEPDLMDITIQKEWVDHSFTAGRPAAIEVDLLKVVNDSTLEKVGDTIILEAKDGYTGTVTGLEKAEYLVEEHPVTNYLLTKVKSEQTDIKGDITFTLINALETTSLTVSKHVEGVEEPVTTPFRMKVTLFDANGAVADVNGQHGGMNFSNGIATFDLHDGQTVIGIGLPVGLQYEVEEINADAAGFEPNYTNKKATLTVNPAHAVVTNTKKTKPSGGGGGGSYTPSTGSLDIYKTVAGIYGEIENRAFVFKVTLDKPFNGNISGVQFTNGVGTLTLRHGEHKYLGGLPAGANYTVAEIDNDGYDVTMTGETGVITVGQTAVAEFVNTKITDPKKDENKDKEDQEKDKPDQDKTEDDVTVPVGGEGSGSDGDDLYDLDDPNAPTGDKDAQDAPKTGDSSHLMMWMLVFLAAFAGLLRVNRPAYKHAKHWF